MEKKKVFFIGTSWSESAVSKHFRKLADELTLRGHKVILIVDKRKRLSNNSVPYKVLSWPSRRPTKIKDLLYLINLTKEHKPDCFIGNFGSVNVLLLGGFLMRVPVRIAWYHTTSDQIKADWKRNIFWIEFYRWRKRIFYRMATHFVANSKYSKLDLSNVFKVPDKKIVVWPNTIQKHPFFRLGQKSAGEKLVILCPGRFSLSKGQIYLIRALPKLLDRYPDISVRFIGDGETLPMCKQEVLKLGLDDVVVFLGKKSHHEVILEMRNAYVTVVPSLGEAFGLVNIESLSTGTPVIASSVGGITEIIRDGHDGFLIPPANPEALLMALNKIFTLSSSSYLQMRKNAVERFLNTYERSRVVERQVSWLENLLN